MFSKTLIWGVLVAATLCSIASADVLSTGESKAIEEAQHFSNVTMAKIDDFINHALPAAARAEAELIRADAQQRLERCEQLATSAAEIWRYKECAAVVLHDSMAALGALIEHSFHSYSSGAMRLNAFW